MYSSTSISIEKRKSQNLLLTCWYLYFATEVRLAFASLICVSERSMLRLLDHLGVQFFSTKRDQPRALALTMVECLMKTINCVRIGRVPDCGIFCTLKYWRSKIWSRNEKKFHDGAPCRCVSWWPFYSFHKSGSQCHPTTSWLWGQRPYYFWETGKVNNFCEESKICIFIS